MWTCSNGDTKEIFYRDKWTGETRIVNVNTGEFRVSTPDELEVEKRIQNETPEDWDDEVAIKK